MNLSLPKLQAVDKKGWLTIIGAAAVLIAIPLTVILLRRYQETRIRALEAGQIVEGSVKITNIHAHGFTVSWATVGESTGLVKWSLSQQALAQTSYDDRATGTDAEKAQFISSTHYVSLPYPPGDDREHPLFREPGQAYDFGILSGDGKLYGGAFDGLFTVEGVAEGAAPITVITGPELASEPLYTSRNLLAPVFYRHWPSTHPGWQQWSVIQLDNPQDSEVSFTFEFTGYERSSCQQQGCDWSTFRVERAVAAHGTYNTQADEELHTLFGSWGDVIGYVRIQGSQPLTGMVRHTWLEETMGQESRLDPIMMMVDSQLLSEQFVATKLVIPDFLRNWYTHTNNPATGKDDLSLWSNLFLTNPGDAPANVTIKIFGEGGAAAKENRQPVSLTITKTVAPHQFYNSYLDSALDPLDKTLGFVVIESDQPIAAYMRDRWVEGAVESSPVRLAADIVAVPDLPQFASKNLTVPLFLRNWYSRLAPEPETGQWSVLQLANPSTTTATFVLDIVMQDTNMQESGEISVEGTIPAESFYNILDDENLWNQLAAYGRVWGYAKVRSNQPLFGLLRQEFNEDTDGVPSRYDYLRQVVNYPYLISSHFASRKLVAPLFVRHWELNNGMEGKSYWSALRLTNENEEPATFSLRIYGYNRQRQPVEFNLGPKTLAPHASYSTYEGSEPHQLVPFGDFAGFVLIDSDQPLMGLTSDLVVEGEELQGQIDLVTENLVYNREGMEREMRCHFSTPEQPDLTPTEAVAPGCPDPVFGEVQRSEGTAAPGTIVYLHLKDGDGQNSSGQAAPLSAIANSEGRYVIDLGNARTQDRSQYFAYDRYNNDLEDVFAEGGTYGQASLSNNPTSNDEPIPTLILNHPPVIDPIPDQTTPKGVLYTYQVSASDADGDPLTYGLGCPDGLECPVDIVTPQGMTISASGEIRWENPTPEGAVFHIGVWVSDGKQGGTTFTYYTLTVGPPVIPPVVIASVTIEPPGPLTLNVGGTVNFTAQAYDSDGSSVDTGVTYTWSVTGDIGTVNPSSSQSTTFTADNAGSGAVKVVATADGSSASAEAQVTVVEPLDCDASRINPAAFPIAPGGTQALTAAPVDGSGDFKYDWSAVDAAGDPAGSFLDDGDNNPATTVWQAPSGAADGEQFNIWVRITDNATGSVCATPRQSATATIEVPGPTLHHVTITPSRKTLTVGQTQIFTAQAYDASSSAIPAGVAYTWEIPFIRDGDIGTIAPDPNDSHRSTFTATKVGSNVVRVNATLGTESASAQAPVTVVNPLSCSVSPEAFTIAPNRSAGTAQPRIGMVLNVAIAGGSGDWLIAWTKTGGSLVGQTNTTRAYWEPPDDTQTHDGDTFTITAAVTDNATQNTCSDFSTATIQATAPSLSISLWMQGRPVASAHPRGSSGPVDIFARQTGQTTKLWEAKDVMIDTDGWKEGIELAGLTSGQTYEFLLKGYIHLAVKKSLSLHSGTNPLDFGTLPTGDFDDNNQVNSLDNDILLTGWETTWNNPQVCDGTDQTYADCKPADFNLDSKVNSIDHDYIFTNWGKNGDE